MIQTTDDFIDDLIESGVLVESDEGALATTETFERTRSVYHDTYSSVSEEVFYESVADVFGFDSPAAAREQIEAQGVTREQFIAYMALSSHLDESKKVDELAHMAMLVSELAPDSPVPDDVIELDDESFEGFLADHERAVVTVWKHHCDPCESLKRDIDAVLGALPDDATVAGVDGDSVPEFRRAYEVDAAPSILFFQDGELQSALSGYATPERVETVCDEAYSSDVSRRVG